MPDRVITAEALITAKDGTGDVFTKIAGKLQSIGKGAKQSVEIDKMTKALERQQSQLRALDKFQATRAKFTDTRAQFNAQKTAVEQAARALASAAKPTRELESALSRTRSAVSKSAAGFEKQKTAMLDAKRAAEGFGSPLAKIASEQSRLRSSIESTTSAIQKQAAAELHAVEAAAKATAAHKRLEHEEERRAHDISHHGVTNLALGAAAGAVSAHGIVHAGEKALDAGAELQHERVASLNAGRTPEELKDYEAAAKKVAIARPTASYTESMKTLLETTSSFGSVEHAIDHLDFMMRTSSVLKAASGGKITESSGQMGQQFAKFFEMRGVANDPERFEHEGNEMVRAMAMTGGTFNPREMFNFATQAKSLLRNYDLDYLSRMVPSLIGEQGGDRAGTAANAFSSVIMGKARDKKQLAKWTEYGLLDPKMVSDKKDSWSSGAVKGTDLALRNPLKWFEQIVLPAMAAKGVKIDDTLELSKALGGMFRNQNSNQFANENAQAADRLRLHKDAALTDKTAAPEEMYQRNLKMDPLVAMQALTASFESLEAAITSPGMQTAAGVITGIAGAMTHLATAAMDHPAAAMTAGAATGAAALGGAGYMSYQIANGFGLGGSATALDASAVALDGAAAALTEAAAVSDAKGLLGTAGKAVGGIAAAEGAATTVGGGILGLGTASSVGLLLGGLVATDAAIMYGLNRIDPHPARGNARFGHAESMRYTEQEPPPPLLGLGPYGDHGPQIVGQTFHRAGRGGYFVDDPAPPTPHPALAPISDSISKTPTFAGFGAGSITATVNQPIPVDVTGKVQLEGQGTVSVVVKVDGPGQVVGQYASSSGNIKVSTGASMPGAKAPNAGTPASH